VWLRCSAGRLQGANGAVVGVAHNVDVIRDRARSERFWKRERRPRLEDRYDASFSMSCQSKQHRLES
jgi:hypothetical protein